MGLKVWLPLNGNLDNQGLTILPNTSANTFTYGNGKIGQCATGRVAWHLTEDILDNTWSVAMWVNPATLGSNNNILFCKNNTGSDDCHIYFSIISTTQLNLGVNGPSSSLAATGLTFNTGTWYHVAATYDGTVATLYLNGQEVKHSNVTTAKPTGRLNMNINGRSTNAGNTSTTGNITCSFNDFRLYDHCLSAAEVREISQGLVLHYKLDSIGALHGNENFILESHKVTGGSSASGITSTYMDDGSLKVVAASGNGNYRSISFAKNSNDNVGAKLSVGDTYTLSCDIKVESGTTLPTIFINSGNSYKRLQGNFTLNQWTQVSYTSTWADPGSSGYGNISLHLGFSGLVGTYYFRNFKLEKSPVPTEWCPSPLDDNYNSYAPTTIYDSSGYNHNGTINSSPIISSETMRYGSSIMFDGVDDCIKIPFNDIIKDKNYTVSVWTYKTSIGTKNYQTILGGPSGFELEARSSSSTSPLYRIHNWGGGTTAYEFNKWNLFTFVHTDSNSKLYVNGELKITGTSANIPTGNYYIGAWNSVTGQNYEGLMSDFRIYCTALDADAIRQLYQVGAKVDNRQNLHTFEIKELSSNIFRSELIMPWAKTTGPRIGEVVEHNGAYALNIAPAPFYQNISGNLSGALNGMFQTGSYVFDMWIDVDSVISGGTNRTGGMIIRYTDDTLDYTFSIVGGNLGYQHKILITPANKNIQRIEFYYYTSTDVFYRIDSCIYPINETKFFKTGIIQNAGFLEDTKSRIIKNGIIETNEIIET